MYINFSLLISISLQELPEKWNVAKKLAIKVRHEVAPLQNAEVMVLRKQCTGFEASHFKL